MDTLTAEELLEQLLEYPDEVVDYKVPITERFLLELPDITKGNWLRDGVVLRPGPLRFTGGEHWLVLWTGCALLWPAKQILVVKG